MPEELPVEKKQRSKSFIESTFVLVLANAIVKVIGACFSIPLTNLIGGDGNGIFTVAYYIYTAMYVIATAGLPVAVSKMVAEANALGRAKQVRQTFRVALLTFLVIGSVGTGVMMLGARFFTRIIGNTMAYQAVLAIAPSIFFVSVVSAIRGYYQGLSDMVPTAFSQLIEALGKLGFGLLLTWVLIEKGYPLETVVAGSISGVTIGTVLSALYMIAVRARDKRVLDNSGDTGVLTQPKDTFKKLVNIAVPVTIGSSVMSLTNLIDMGVVMNRLQDAGMTEVEANFIYGCYSMAVKLFNLPQTLIVAISISVIPTIAAAYIRKNIPLANRTTETAFRLTALMAMPCAVGLAVLAEPILGLLYFNIPDEVAIAAPLLRIISPAVLMVGLVSVVNALLQGMGRERIPVITMLCGGVVKLVANYIMVGNPAINIHGAPVSTTLCYSTIAILGMIVIHRQGIRISYFRVFGKPLISAAVMGVFAWLAFGPVSALLGAKLGCLVTVGLSAVIYLLMLIATKALPKEDVLMMPKGAKIAKLLRIE